ncbi:MAG: hypothetical protein AB2693_22600 [Candidatus Thiodiazotropha sp.]
MLSHYRELFIIYRNGKETGRWYVTQTGVNTSGLPTSEMAWQLPLAFMDKETSKAKYFGVTIDSKLSWNSHTDAVTKEPTRLQLSYTEIFQAAHRM